ncbi:MFS transporter [uncultured Eubacterium sp.]|uniref:MFS transporter n=1 Tax=uncultured Eubacterium sp. TaxID=165185 RepID=UPI0025D2D9C0|nr:MFS transporter [uncultured Eubacterium sp.]
MADCVSEKNAEKKYVSKKELVNFLAGISGQNLVYSLIGGSFFTYFMTDIALFPAITVSVLLIVMKVWDGINDPIVGSFIDRHTFKNGEKLRPFLKYTPLPVGVFTVLLFLVFSTNENLLWLRVSYFIIMYICWDLAYTVQDVSVWGITAAVSPNSSERDRFVQWSRTIGSMVYGAFSTVIPMALEMIANAKGMSMSLVTLVFAIIFGLGGSMLSYRCSYARERIAVNKDDQQETLRESFMLLFKNKMLLLVTLSNLFGSFGFGISLVTYFFKYEIPSDFLGNGIIGALGLTTIYFIITGLPSFIGMLFADWMKKRLGGYVNVLILIQVFNIVARAIAFFVGFEGKRLWISMIIIGIGSIPSGASSIAQTSIFCDSIDYMEWKTGKRTEGITFSMQTSFTKISSGITSGLATLALHLLGYKAIDNAANYLGTQTAAFDSWIWPLVVLTPAVASVLFIIPLLFVNYTKEKRALVESDLNARRNGLAESGESPYAENRQKD